MDEHQGNCPYCGTGPMWETPGDPEWLTMWACGTATSDDANGQIGQSDMCRINELEAANARLSSLLAATAEECKAVRQAFDADALLWFYGAGEPREPIEKASQAVGAAQDALDVALLAAGTTLAKLAKKKED